MTANSLNVSIFLSTSNHFRALSWCLSLLSLLACAWLAPLQGQLASIGTVEGRVFDEVSGDYLRNVMISIAGTNLHASTNAEGEYQLSNVPAGSVTLEVSYPGYLQQTRILTLNAGTTMRQDFSFTASSRAVADVVTLAAFSVRERQMSAETAALEEQRRAANIKSVVSLEEIGDLGVSTPGTYLMYMPGIATVNTTGEIGEVSVRGMGPEGTVVMIDGMSAASSSPDSRTFSFFGSVVPNAIERIEVNKVPTPDLPANAIGGSVNLIEKSARTRRTPLLTYNVFGTFMARFSPEALEIGLKKRDDGIDRKSNLSPVQPGFDLSYLHPINESFAVAFTASRNARLQDREVYLKTWDKIKYIQTAETFNSVLNIFETSAASMNLDARLGRSTIRLGVSYTASEANARQNNFVRNFGAGATGGEDFTQGAIPGVGTVTRSGGNTNQDRSLLKTNFIYRYEAGNWKFDLGAIRTRATRNITNFDDGMFQGFSANITQLVLGISEIGNIHRMAYPKHTAANRAGAAVDIFDVTKFSLNSVASNQVDFESFESTVSANIERHFATRVPFTLKIGGLINGVSRDDLRDIRSWSFTPPNASTGGRLVGNYDLIAQGYSDRRTFRDGVKQGFISGEKLYRLYEENPAWFVENLVTRHTNRVNNSKEIDETISAAYARADVSLGRLNVTGGVRFEHTEDEGRGPLNDISATYQKDANGQIIRDAQGRPLPITTDALARAQLQLKERAQYFETKYSGWYPSINARYDLTKTMVLRAGYAHTIGRPDLELLIPSTTIPDPDGTNRNITVTSRNLEPWSATNYDLTLETYQLKGATISLSIFRKDITNFHYRTIVPLTPGLVALYSLPEYLLTEGDWNLASWSNSSEDARNTGFEWSWRQQLNEFSSLPHWLRGVSFSANGTHIRITGAGKDEFINYTPKVITWSVNYRLKGFNARVNVYNSKGRRMGLVAASATVPPGAYQVEGSRTMIGASVGYQLSRRLTVQLNANNLTDSIYRQIIYAPGIPGYATPSAFRRLGIEYTIGIRGAF